MRRGLLTWYVGAHRLVRVQGKAARDAELVGTRGHPHAPVGGVRIVQGDPQANAAAGLRQEEGIIWKKQTGGRQ